MKNSSNTDMKQVFEQLANVNKVEPSINLYAQTLNKIQRQKIIPLFWVKVVACLFILFIGSEFYLTTNKNNTAKKDISIIIYKTNNILYDE
jgi:hypothetical protein